MTAAAVGAYEGIITLHHSITNGRRMTDLMEGTIAAAVAQDELSSVVVACLVRIRPVAAADAADNFVCSRAKAAELIAVKVRPAACMKGTSARTLAC